MPDPIFSSRSTACTVGPGHSLDLHSLDGAVQVYFAAGLAKSTHRTYETAGKRYTDFCRDFALNPFPVTEPILLFCGMSRSVGFSPHYYKNLFIWGAPNADCRGIPRYKLTTPAPPPSGAERGGTTARHTGSLSKAAPHVRITSNILRKMPGAVRGP